MGINFELLKKTIDFPLRKDEFGGFIWSRTNQMVAQLKNCDTETKLRFIGNVCGKMRTFDGECTESMFKLTKDLSFTKINSDEPFGLVRGWGDFQYNTNKRGIKKYDPERGAIIQDNLAAYLIKCLNTPRNA